MLTDSQRSEITLVIKTAAARMEHIPDYEAVVVAAFRGDTETIDIMMAGDAQALFKLAACVLERVVSRVVEDDEMPKAGTRS